MSTKETHEHTHSHAEVTHSHDGQEHHHQPTVHSHGHTHDEGHHGHEHIKKGMSCEHCVAAVTKALLSLPGISGVEVSLSDWLVSYQRVDPISPEDLDRVIRAAGYELAPA